MWTPLILTISFGCFERTQSSCSLLQQTGCETQQFCALNFQGQAECVSLKEEFTSLAAPCTRFDECGPQKGCFDHFGISLCLPFCNLDQIESSCPSLEGEQSQWSEFGECILSIDEFNSLGLCTYPCQSWSTHTGYGSCSWETETAQCDFVPNLSFSVCTSVISELGLDPTQALQQQRTRFETCSSTQVCEESTQCISAFGTSRCVSLIAEQSELIQCPDETFLYSLPHLFDPIQYDLYSVCWPCGADFETECNVESQE